MDANSLKLWDQYAKLLANGSPQALVSFLMPNAVFKHVVDRELQVPSLIADGLYEVVWRKKRIILHVEFQKWRDNNMGRRMWQYNALANMHTKLPVYSVVIYLRKHKRPVGSPYVIPLPDGRPTQRLDFEPIKLWEIPSGFFEQHDLIGLLPLLPLTKDGKNPETVERMIQILRKRDEKELLGLSYAFASLVFTTERDHKRLVERFASVQDILAETRVFRELIAQGEKKGLGEGLLQFVEMRFPTLLAQAQLAVERQTSVEQLRAIINKVYRANTTEEAKAALLADK